MRLCPKTSAKHEIADFCPLGITFRIFEMDDIRRLLYPLSGFENAFTRKDGEMTDVLAVCAIKDNRIIAIAGASNDSELMWQIGIDVLPEFREMGLASALVSTITDEITALDKIPYYSLLFGNIASLNTALSCGYQPMFAEIIASK
jgi:predicted GNAT family acetyltransferase